MVVSSKGMPITFCFFPASVADLKGFEFLSGNLPKGSLVLGDKAYYSRRLIEKLGEEEIFLLAAKRKDSKTPYSERVKNWIKSTRQRIETTFSQILRYMGRNIVARTRKGFETRLILFILAYSISLSRA